MVEDRCPDNDALMAHARGASGDRADQIEEHLAGCARCEDRLSEFERVGQPASFLESLQRLPPTMELEAGRYEILNRIGSGAFSDVYRGFDHRLKRTVAIKKTQRVIGGPLPQRLVDEAKTLAQFKSPHVVEIYDSLVEAGVPFFVLEYVDGHDLEECLQNHGAFPIDAACEVIRQAAEGLAQIHDQAYVHRDLHPGNVLLTDDGEVKICDLGLAHRPDAVVSSQSLNYRLGAGLFRAPEQAGQAHLAGPTADVFPLGCLLFFLLTGGTLRRHYSTQSIQELEVQLTALQMRRPLRRLMHQMLAADPAARPSARQVADELQPFSSREALSGHLQDSSSPESGSETRRKSPAKIAAFVALGALLSLAAIYAGNSKSGSSVRPGFHPLASDPLQCTFEPGITLRRFPHEIVPGEYSFEVLDDAVGTLAKRNMDTIWFYDHNVALAQARQIDWDSATPEFRADIPPGTHKVTARICRYQSTETPDDPADLVADELVQFDRVVWLLYAWPDLACDGFTIVRDGDTRSFGNLGSPEAGPAVLNVNAGEQLDIEFGLTNQGTVKSQPGQINVYLSPGAETYSGEPVEVIRYAALDMNQQQSISAQVRIPESQDNRTLYLGFVIDAEDTTVERDELKPTKWLLGEGTPMIPEHDEAGRRPLNNRWAVRLKIRG